MTPRVSTTDVMMVLEISQDIDKSALKLEKSQYNGFGTNIVKITAFEPHAEHISKIVGSLHDISTEIRIIASNILNEKIAAETGKEVDDEPAG